MMNRFCKILAVILWTSMGALARADDTTPLSVVKIETTHQSAHTMAPWNKHSSAHSSGTGVIIDGNRILTNAHVVINAVEISVQPGRSTEKWSATVAAIAPGIDLAVLKLEDESLFKTHGPIIKSRDSPRIQDGVTVYGYPEGGSELSITKGIVSRIEFSAYWYEERGLRIQVDAAINPGNSGGPVLCDGKFVGIVFSKLRQADNIGYIIPCEEIDLFLRDIADGHYDGKPVLLAVVRHLENSALRGKLGLPRSATGVLVTASGGREPGYPLHDGDILTRIGDYAIDNSGMVRIENDYVVDFAYLIQKVAVNNRIRLTIYRAGQELKVDVPVSPDRDQWLCPYLKDRAPAYFVYGALAFSEASRDLVQELIKDSDTTDYLAYRSNPLLVRYGERPSFEGEHLVYVAGAFSHRIIKGYASPGLKVVGEVNGTRVRNLKHLVEILRDATGEYVEFTFVANHPERMVFRRNEALRATDEVLERNGIRAQGSADLLNVWRRELK